MRSVKVRTKSEFPVTPGEQFVVRDGSGRIVERWHHVHSMSFSKTHSTHIYDVEGYDTQL